MDVTSLKQLEDAARAAGYEPIRLTDDGTALLLEGIQQPWNPRDENPHSDCMGDALRLAVKLGLNLYTDRIDRWVVCGAAEAIFYDDTKFGGTCDPYAATRRAVVMAAAKIGETL